MAKEKSSLKLKDILISEIKKSDDQKAVEAVEKQVRLAARAMRSEVEAAEDNVEAIQARLDAAIRDVNSTGAHILELNRQLALASANATALAELNAERF
jgi:hypothetical protein